MPVEIKQNPGTSLRYNPQLDGLRFCAVLFVVSYHWFPSISHTTTVSFLGGMVNFFFVLSSYLITTILFSARRKSEQQDISTFRVMTVFWLRRTIRIFPAYYFFLLVLLLVPSIGAEISEHASTYFTYLTNYQIYNSHDFPKATAHIWTLAVEEQFYLLWPFVILLVPRQHLLKTFMSIIIATVLIRVITYEPTNGVSQVIQTQYCVDAFAVGALLAFKPMATEAQQKAIHKYLNLVLWIGIPLALATILMHWHFISFVFNRLLFSIVSYKIIEGAVKGYKNYFGKFLENKTVVGLGRLSYGIYLYHLLVPVVFWKLYKLVFDYEKAHHPGFFTRHKEGFTIFQKIMVTEVVGFVIYAAIVIVIARLSWKFIEQPFYRFKVDYNTSIRKKTYLFFSKIFSH